MASLRIIESRFATPDNAPAGWYVVVAGEYDELTLAGSQGFKPSTEASALASGEAQGHGYLRTLGSRGMAPFTRNHEYAYAFWFYATATLPGPS